MAVAQVRSRSSDSPPGHALGAALKERHTHRIGTMGKSSGRVYVTRAEVLQDEAGDTRQGTGVATERGRHLGSLLGAP